jgi:hypothetical protein
MAHPPLRPQDAGEGWGGGDCLVIAPPIPAFPRKRGKEQHSGGSRSSSPKAVPLGPAA